MIKNKVKDYISQNLLVFDEDIKLENDDNIFEKGYVNSMFSMQLLNFVEKEYSITFRNEDIDAKNFSSVNNIEAIIKKYIND